MRINIGGTWWKSDALDSIPQTSLGLSEAAALRLLQEWTRGQQEFTFHTSGSTGTPRPVTFQRHQLEASAQLSIRVLGLKKEMTALCCLDARYVAGAMMVLRSMIAEMDLIIHTPSANPLKEVDDTVDFLAVVPLQLVTLLDESPSLLNKVSIVIIGGSPLADSILPRLESIRPTCYATYGMTETLTHVALQKLNGAGRQQSFHLLPFVSAQVDDRGCLSIVAPHLGPDPIQTNDLVQWTDDGGFQVVGRFDDVINSGGIKIQPGRVAYAVGLVMQQMGIRCRYFVTGIPDERLNEAVGLVLEGSPLPGAVEEELHALLAAKLDRFEVPRVMLYSPHFVETATQKIDKQATLSLIERKTT